MGFQTPSFKTGNAQRLSVPPDTSQVSIAFNEYELASRWGMSVMTLRRWRQEQLGPIFCKCGSRVIYLISEVEVYERRVSRHSTSARAYA